MMDRMVEGRAHRWEMDMLLELTYVPFYSTLLLDLAFLIPGNELRVVLSARWTMPRHGRFKA